MSRSITFKLILAFLLVGVVGVALASAITYWLTVREFKRFTYDQALDRILADVTFYYQVNGTWDGVLDYYKLRNPGPPAGNFQQNPQLPGPGEGQRQIAFFFILADRDGRVLIPAGAYQVGDTVPADKLAEGTPVTVDEKQVGTVLVVRSAPPLGPLEEKYLNRTNLALLYAALGASVVALLLGIILARALTHPLRDLTTGIRAIARGDLKQNVKVKSKDELGELAAAFNQMSADLDRLIQARRQMTADIAHELRNPLTVIGGYIESMREGVLKPTPERLNSIQVEVQHLQRLVEDLRILSQADAGELRLNREPVSMSALLERMAQSYRPLADRQQITLTNKVMPDLPEINADPDRLAQVLGNLITNSLRYTPKGGEITLEALQEDNHLLLSVRDTGHGISPEALPYIFDRFYRADPARTRGDESGLGLAIAKSIIEAHAGTISAESQLGTGTTIKINLPL
jgi:two-component system sensor histidine kinase BaeS